MARAAVDQDPSGRTADVANAFDQLLYEAGFAVRLFLLQQAVVISGTSTRAEITLPSGTVLTVPPGSVGENLFKFLTGTETGSKTFLFDGLTFDRGQATLDARSQATITAIADILQEFGTVTVSVDGYTDNTGTREANLQLSQARAEQVLAALAAAGIDTSRMTATGHADDNPVADNGTEEGRAQNRRTELTATKN